MAALRRGKMNLRYCRECYKRTAHYASICLRCPDWGIRFPERIAEVYVNDGADSRDVMKRLSNSWRINYKIAGRKDPFTRIDAVLQVLYCEPMQQMKRTTPFEHFPEGMAS